MTDLKKKILLIDDDRYFLKSLYELLIDEGYYVIMAKDAMAAREWLSEKDLSQFDLIISDERMPGEEGSSFLYYLSDLQKRGSIPPCPRVILSGYAESDTIRKALQDEIINKFISKRAGAEGILREIHSLLTH